jgi:hypothetical protein
MMDDPAQDPTLGRSAQPVNKVDVTSSCWMSIAELPVGNGD